MAEDASLQVSRTEAVALLVACQGLAARLAAEGLNLNIDEAEELTLLGFKKVWLAGYLEGSSHIYRQASLSRGDLAALNRLLALHQGESMQRQHEEGNG